MMAHAFQQRVAAQRKTAGVKDEVAHADEEEEQRDFKWIHQVIGDLRRYQIEPEHPCQQQAQQGCRAEQRVHPDDTAQRKRPGEHARRGAHSQQVEQWGDDASLKEARSGMQHGRMIERVGGGGVRI